MARVEFQAEPRRARGEPPGTGRARRSAPCAARSSAMQPQDVELCDEVIAFDDEIDDRYHRIEKSIEEILAQQAPVATDLRLVLAVLHNSIHLERIGDQSVTIAKLTKLSAELEHPPRPRRGPRGDGRPGRGDGPGRARLVRGPRRREGARALVDLDELIDRTNRRVVDHVLQMAAAPGPAGVGDADDRRRRAASSGSATTPSTSASRRRSSSPASSASSPTPPTEQPLRSPQRHRAASLPSRSSVDRRPPGSEPGRVRGLVHTTSRRRGCNAMKKSLAAALRAGRRRRRRWSPPGRPRRPRGARPGRSPAPGRRSPSRSSRSGSRRSARPTASTSPTRPSAPAAGSRRSPRAPSTSAPPTRRSRRPARRMQGLRRQSRGRSSATSIPYNIPGINGRLRLTGPMLAHIYLGRDLQLERRAAARDQPGPEPAGPEDHAGVPLRRVRDDVQLHRVPLVGEPALEEQGRHQHERQLPDGRRRPRQLRRRRCRPEHRRAP